MIACLCTLALGGFALLQAWLLRQADAKIKRLTDKAACRRETLLALEMAMGRAVAACDAADGQALLAALRELTAVLVEAREPTP